MNQTSNKKGLLFIISAPSGAGKTSLVKSLVGRDPKLLASISYTTRPRRPDEKQDIAYHFIDEATFQSMVEANSFLEHASVFRYHYGTPSQWVTEQLEQGNDIVLEIDWQGAQQVRQKTENTVSLFILPPSFQALEERLNNRGEDQETVIQRMREAKNELSHYNEYDYLVINNDFETALEELEAIIRAARHGYRLQKAHFDDFARQLLEQTANIQ